MVLLTIFGRLETFTKFLEAVRKFQDCERKWYLYQIILNASQSMVYVTGLLGACLYVVHLVITNVQKPGNLVMLIAYWTQLSGKLELEYYYS